jgi:hypothetical protein
MPISRVSSLIVFFVFLRTLQSVESEVRTFSTSTFETNCSSLQLEQYFCSPEIDPSTQQPKGCSKNNLAHSIWFYHLIKHNYLLTSYNTRIEPVFYSEGPVILYTMKKLVYWNISIKTKVWRVETTLFQKKFHVYGRMKFKFYL